MEAWKALPFAGAVVTSRLLSEGGLRTNSKERILLALQRREPDRVPIWATVVPENVALESQGCLPLGTAKAGSNSA